MHSHVPALVASVTAGGADGLLWGRLGGGLVVDWSQQCSAAAASVAAAVACADAVTTSCHFAL